MCAGRILLLLLCLLMVSEAGPKGKSRFYRAMCFMYRIKYEEGEECRYTYFGCFVCFKHVVDSKVYTAEVSNDYPFEDTLSSGSGDF